MAIIGNPWAQDAGRFGEGVGNALSQGMMQLPQQRYMMALQQAQMAQRQQQMAQNFTLQQQKAQEMGQYHSDELGLRKQALDQTGQYHNDNLGIRQQQADNQWTANRNRMLGEIAANHLRQQQIEKPYSQGGLLFQPNQSGQPQDGLQQTNQVPAQPQQPWSVTPAPTQPKSIDLNQVLGALTKATGQYGAYGANTNLPPDIRNQGLNTSSNLMVNLQKLLPLLGLGQTNQPGMMQQTNQPGMMQSNSLPPWALQQLPDGSFNFVP